MLEMGLVPNLKFLYLHPFQIQVRFLKFKNSTLDPDHALLKVLCHSWMGLAKMIYPYTKFEVSSFTRSKVALVAVKWLSV